MIRQDRLIDYVNPLQGTDSESNFSRGNTLPLLARPFGMTHWTAQTDEANWAFAYRAVKLQGIRATHQPSPWLGDYGHINIMPTVGPLLLNAYAWSSFYRKNEAVFQPNYFKARLSRYQTLLETTPTERCACIRVTFPKTQEAHLILQPFKGESEISVDSASGTITGYTRSANFTPKSFALYFAAVVDRPITDWGLFSADGVCKNEPEMKGERVGAYLNFDATQDQQVNLRIATSFISVEQAKLNLEQEIGSRSFDEIKDDGAEVWEKELGRIEVEDGTQDQLRTFYTCLYRTLLFPRIFHEYDSDGKKTHYSPFDGKIHEGEMYTDNGFWDTHRTMYSLLALIAPERLGDIMRGWTNSAKEGGWFPRWASPGYCNCMIGTHMDDIVADAYLRGVKDFDIKAAYEGMLRDATQYADPTTGYGRRGLEAYHKLGYVPADEVEHAASRTQDYAYNDFGVAQIARVLGLEEDAKLFYQRAKNYINTYDPQIGFMRGRNADGSWQEPFDEFEWGGAFIEGSAWQCTWAVPHDPAGLIELMGGRDAFTAKLDLMMSMEPIYHAGVYNQEIHEMTEMAAVDFGQYAHSNQPVHHVLYLYTCAKQPWKTQYWVRRVMDELYSPDNLPGDEDNGEMCGWYVLNALGIYPLCPGDPTFVFGSPLFKRATVHLESGSDLVVDAQDNDANNVYVQEVKLNGEHYGKTWVAHEDLMRGGTIAFAMSSEANIQLELNEEDLPFSLSNMLK